MALSQLAMSVLIAALPLVFTLYTAYSSYLRWLESPTRGLPYPPGPSSVTLLNAAKVLPQANLWMKYTEWAKKYGDMIHLKIYGKHTIILSKHEDAVELLERRSVHYSDRVKSSYINLMGWDFNVELMPHGSAWRSHRKMLQQCFREKATLAYQPVQARKVRNMLAKLLARPEDFMSHCRNTSISVLISSLYGDNLTEEDTESFVQVADQVMDELGKSFLPGRLIRHYIPLLKYLPAWFPGAEFKHQAEEFKELAEQMQDMTMSFVGQTIIKGTSTSSLMSDLLENCYVQKEFDVIKHVAATSFTGGVDTTASSLCTFFLAMALHPDAQSRAQEEIDALLGKGSAARLPTFEDRPKLPYVEALYREVMRWRPVFPLNTAHVTTSEDIYKGFYIPKGASIIANIWAMTRDAEKYLDPESFKPEHFLDKNGSLNDDETVLTFGYGRRNCPGRHMASATIWMTIVSVLATFDIRNKKDKKGVEIPISPSYSDGMISHPLPFQCSITPRNESVKNLIQRAQNS